eukprot:maker-scaffold_1-snap-gene-29.37-mRNA-1 protein AED:0.33 eAED:0.33 QI:0/1/0.5/1/1/1/2/223/820
MNRQKTESFRPTMVEAYSNNDLLAFTEDLDFFPDQVDSQPSYTNQSYQQDSLFLHTRSDLDRKQEFSGESESYKTFPKRQPSNGSQYSFATGLNKLSLNSPQVRQSDGSAIKPPQFDLSEKYKKRAPIKKWTAVEDSVLRSGIMSYVSKGLKIDFEAVAARIPGRSVKQAKERWKNSLNPTIRKGEWQSDELFHLLDLIIQHGQNWTEIQRKMSSRSMHCIKSKGRKLLGETMSKRLLKKCLAAYHGDGGSGNLEKNSKIWTEQENSKMLASHESHIMEHNPNLLQGSSVIEYIGSESMDLMLETVSVACGSVGKSRPLAVVDRRLLLICKCSICSFRLKQMNLPRRTGFTADVEKCGSEFKVSWTSEKAKSIKNMLMDKMKNQPLQNSSIKVKKTRKNRIKREAPRENVAPVPLDDGDLYEGLDLLLDDSIAAFDPFNEGGNLDTDIPVIDTDSYYSGATHADPFLKTENFSGFSDDAYTPYSDHTSFDSWSHHHSSPLNPYPPHPQSPIHSHGSPIKHERKPSYQSSSFPTRSKSPLKAGKRSRKRGSDSEGESRERLRKLDYEMDEETQKVFEEVLGQYMNQSSGDSKNENPLLLTSGGGVKEKKDEDAEELLTMVKNYHRTGSQSESSASLARKVVSVISDYLSKDQLSRLHGEMKKNNIQWLNPKILFQIDRVNLTEDQNDLRYQKEYLNPEPEEVSFDPGYPVGTYIVNFVSRVFIDVDNESKEIARGSMLNQHSWKFVPSKLEAVLRIYYVIPRLFKTGSAWSYVRMYRCDGTEAIFLAKYELLSREKKLALVKFQDVSFRMKHILTLPPPVY